MKLLIKLNYIYLFVHLYSQDKPKELQFNRFSIMEHLKLQKQIFYGTSSSSESIMFCSGTSVPPLGHFGPQPSDPRPDKIGTEPKPPTYIPRRHLSFCPLVRRFRTRVLSSSLTFLYNFSSACKHEVLRFLDKLRLTSWLLIPQRGQETCRLLYIKPEFCQATNCADTLRTLPVIKRIIFVWES